ncbi:hypothetical protein C8258_21300 [Nocardia sp. MDA0666]|uniref:hypothetical protein n=1 Tax=Nocardia sp. MDA0666 TaxID=2135448 RepID=UPI000D13289B|nr:hypothetical protein [Nocardia sp. MDA0666]PSR65784.1 hypothetical protein C8258_21300 [Nocardia sp. MDA0666]
MTGNQPPEFDGKCAFAVSAAGVERAPTGKSKHTVVEDGKTYVFGGAVPKLLFRLLPGSARRAQARWAAGQTGGTGSV